MRRSILACVTVVAVLGCAPKKVRQADSLAKQGDWERALTEYRLATVEHPNESGIKERIAKAEKEVAVLYLARAEAANAAGRLGEAGDLWRKAIELSPDPAVQEKARLAIADNSAALEYYGDISAEFFAWDDAIGAYGALLTVQNDSVDLLERYRASKREQAGELTLASDELSRRDLKGAALVASLRAMQHDPMVPGGFDRVTELRKSLAGRTKVDVELKLEDHGYKGLGLALTPKLTPRLDDYPPYAPTRDGNAIPATLLVSIESFSKADSVVKGSETLPNELPQPTEPVPNPAIEEQKKKIAGLQAELKSLQAELKKTLPGKSAKPAPSAKKKKKLAAEAEKKRVLGLELARKVDAKRKEIWSEKQLLTALPAKVPPPPLPKTWELPWTETTRHVEAKVRFEIREKDGETPIFVTLTHRIEKKDRAYEGNEKQGMMPDKLELPSWDALCADLAEQFVAEGPAVIAKARERRVEKLLAQGRTKLKMNDDEAALDAFVDALFILGPEQLPQDAAVLVATEAENERLKEILGTK